MTIVARATDCKPPVLILFAKCPIPGQVKTRMSSVLTDVQAATLAEMMIGETVQRASRHWKGPIELHVWPTSEHPLFRRLAEQPGIAIERQVAGDLGEKMYRALQYAGGSGVVMGCDVPHCPPAIWRQIQQRLAAGENIIGPTEDGGYYCIGLQRPVAGLFRGINWGSNLVFTQTRSCAAKLGIPLAALPKLRDLDHWADLATVRDRLPDFDAFLKQLGH